MCGALRTLDLKARFLPRSSLSKANDILQFAVDYILTGHYIGLVVDCLVDRRNANPHFAPVQFQGSHCISDRAQDRPM